MDEGERLDLMAGNLDRVIGWISRLDTKVSIILGIDLALIGFLGSSVGEALSTGFWAALSLFASMALVAVSLAFLAVAAFPRTKPPRSSVFYFGSIADEAAESYHQAMANMAPGEFLEDITGQIHTLSDLVSRKFRAVQRALVCLFVAVIPWMATEFVVGV